MGKNIIGRYMIQWQPLTKPIDRSAWEDSVKGIRGEINERTWKIQALIDCVVGHEGRFMKPVRKKLPVIQKALALHREVEKLRQIKKQMQSQL